MYEEYFGLERPPFKITPDTSLFFEGGKRGDILDALVYAIHRGEGIIKVVGEVGSGKTMLCRMLQLKVPDTVEIVYIANPSVSPEDILFVIAHELSLDVTRHATKHEVMHQLHDYLLQRHMENKQVVLFVEEAQGMPLDTLEEIRLLSNLETDQNKLLQIILFGQPELDQNLAEQSIRQLRERITHNFELDPLTPDEIHNYLNFRMRQVGYTGPELINRNVAKKIEQHSAGLLRRINIIADKLLLSAFAEGTHNLDSKHVTAAVNDSTFDDKVKTKSGLLTWLSLIAIVALCLGIYQTSSLWLAQDQTNISSQVAAVKEPRQSEAEPITPPVEPDSVVEASAAAKPAGDFAGHVSGVSEQSGQTADSSPEDIASGLDEANAGEVSVEEIAAIEADELSNAGEVALHDESGPTRESTLAPVEQVVMQRQAERGIDAPNTGGSEMTVDSSGSVELTEQELTAEPGEQIVLSGEAADDELSWAAQAGLSDVDLARKETAGVGGDYEEWLLAKLYESKEWLRQAPRDNVSIQVLMRNKSAERELVEYLRDDWPLDISKTYLYEVDFQDQKIYRVFYSEFNTLALGRDYMEQLPESIKVNSPYLHSVYRMRKALL